MPEIDINKLTGSLLKAGEQIKGKANEIDLDPAVKKIVDFRQWFEKRLENAIEAAEKENGKSKAVTFQETPADEIKNNEAKIEVIEEKPAAEKSSDSGGAILKSMMKPAYALSLNLSQPKVWKIGKSPDLNIALFLSDTRWRSPILENIYLLPLQPLLR